MPEKRCPHCGHKVPRGLEQILIRSQLVAWIDVTKFVRESRINDLAYRERCVTWSVALALLEGRASDAQPFAVTELPALPMLDPLAIV
jgi:hypothetical protein